MTPDEVIAQARETADRFLRLVAELERAQAQAALAGELQVEVDRLRAEQERMGTLAFESSFLVYGEPEQLIFRGPNGPVVLRRLRDGDPAAAIGRVRELHRNVRPGGYCEHCGKSYPCPTVQALEGA